MSTQWDIDLICNLSFTCMRLKLSCTIHPHTSLKIKLMAKYFLKNMIEQALIDIF